MLLDVEKRRLILEAQLHDRLVHRFVELQPLVHLDREEQVENALAHRSYGAHQRKIAVLEDDMAARDNHHRVGLVRLQECAQRLKPG